MRREIQKCPRQPMVIVGLIMIGLLVACGPRLQRATVPMMDEGEAAWQADPIPSYHVVVEMERTDERRRYEVTVEQGEIVQGSIAYWDDDRREWDTPIELSEEQSFPFTVPGLFDMVRGELRGSGRRNVRVAMQGEPPFPYRIELGPIWLEGKLLSDTEVLVFVREFELSP